MDKKELLAFCNYYKGEPNNPYQGKDFGKAFWWKLELYAIEADDEKECDMLSMTMVNYLKEHLWEGEGQYGTTKEEMLKRADELYNHGIWSRDYIGLQRYTFQQAVQYSKSN